MLNVQVDEADMETLVQAAELGSDKARRWAWAKLIEAGKAQADHTFRIIAGEEAMAILAANIERFRARLAKLQPNK